MQQLITAICTLALGWLLLQPASKLTRMISAPWTSHQTRTPAAPCQRRTLPNLGCWRERETGRKREADWLFINKTLRADNCQPRGEWTSTSDKDAHKTSDDSQRELSSKVELRKKTKLNNPNSPVGVQQTLVPFKQKGGKKKIAYVITIKPNWILSLNIFSEKIKTFRVGAEAVQP